MIILHEIIGEGGPGDPGQRIRQVELRSRNEHGKQILFYADHAFRDIDQAIHPPRHLQNGIPALNGQHAAHGRIAPVAAADQEPAQVQSVEGIFTDIFYIPSNIDRFYRNVFARIEKPVQIILVYAECSGADIFQAFRQADLGETVAPKKGQGLYGRDCFGKSNGFQYHVLAEIVDCEGTVGDRLRSFRDLIGSPVVRRIAQQFRPLRIKENAVNGPDLSALSVGVSGDQDLLQIIAIRESVGRDLFYSRRQGDGSHIADLYGASLQDPEGVRQDDLRDRVRFVKPDRVNRDLRDRQAVCLSRYRQDLRVSLIFQQNRGIFPQHISPDPLFIFFDDYPFFRRPRIYVQGINLRRMVLSIDIRQLKLQDHWLLRAEIRHAAELQADGFILRQAEAFFSHHRSQALPFFKGPHGSILIACRKTGYRIVINDAVIIPHIQGVFTGGHVILRLNGPDRDLSLLQGRNDGRALIHTRVINRPVIIRRAQGNSKASVGLSAVLVAGLDESQRGESTIQILHGDQLRIRGNVDHTAAVHLRLHPLHGYVILTVSDRIQNRVGSAGQIGSLFRGQIQQDLVPAPTEIRHRPVRGGSLFPSVCIGIIHGFDLVRYRNGIFKEAVSLGVQFLVFTGEVDRQSGRAFHIGPVGQDHI